MATYISSIGTALPTHQYRQKDVAMFMTNYLDMPETVKTRLEQIYDNSCINTRHSILKDYANECSCNFYKNNLEEFPGTAERMKLFQEQAVLLGKEAVNNCLANIPNFNKENITHIITISCTGMSSPGLDIDLIRELGLKTDISRIMINFMGCSATFNALLVAQAVCNSESDANVLIVGVEISSIHLQRKININNVVTSALFSDGAAALLVQANPKQEKAFKLLNLYSEVVPDTYKDVTWDIGDEGFLMTLAPTLPGVIEAGLADYMNRALKKFNLNLSDINLFAIHPGGKRILESCEKALMLTKEDDAHAYYVLQNFGNMSSVTMVFVLNEIWKSLDIKQHNQNIIALGFGPGLVIESGLFRIHYKL